MSTGPHIVTHTGQTRRERRCHRAGCGQPGTHLRNGTPYCAEHVAQGYPEVTPHHVAAARALMRLDPDWTLQGLSTLLGVARSELDIALFRNIAEPLGRQPRGMFR